MEEKKEMNVYLYVFMLTAVTAFILSLLFTNLNPVFVANKAEAKKKAILSCVPDSLDLSSKEKISEAYQQITMYAVSAERPALAIWGVDAASESQLETLVAVVAHRDQCQM